MPPALPSEEPYDELLTHLEGLFALAQVVTPNAEEAVRLVERTYRQAFADPAEHASEEEQRVWLYRMLLEARDAPDESGAVPRRELVHFRQRLADRFVDHALPPAFSALASEERLLLMLCDVQGLTCGAAGRVMGIDEGQACRRLDEARDRLRDALHGHATQVERHLLDTGLEEQWAPAALKRMAESELHAVPPTLRPSILAVADTRQEPKPGTPSPEASQNGRTLIGGLAKRVAAMLLIIGVAGLLGYGFSRLMDRTPDLNLVSLSASQAFEVEAGFQTASAEQAERYVYDRLGRRITVPLIGDAALQGVSIRDIADGAEVPVLVYRAGEMDETVVVYVYSYAFLDRHSDRLVLKQDILSQIEDEGHFDLHDLGDDKALIWRRRDDILIAITSGDAEELRGRISYPA